MRIVVAPDKFKNSLDSAGVCAAIASGLKQVLPESMLTCLPLSDGGDGMAAVLQQYGHFQKIETIVAGPLGRLVTAYFLYEEASRLALVEMAQASGLHLLQPEEYDPLRTSTLGTGQLILAALNKGAKRVIIGIGGSATNDGGMGMAAALGYRFLDAMGDALPPCGDSLQKVRSIDTQGVVQTPDVRFEVASDVTNPLTGPQGASLVFAPQKGADPDTAAALDAGMVHFASVVRQALGTDMTGIAGGGAAGGMGAGCVAFLSAAISSGAELVLQYSNAATHIAAADLVISGEGRLDATTFNGKLVEAVAALCRQHHKPLIVLCGSVDVDTQKLQEKGIAAAFSILPQPMTLQQAMAGTPELLQQTAAAIGGVLRLAAGIGR